ncbi:MAG: U32 family peptidase [Clostridia bacterium]|nr:U32 family peptidase [Clostridia bacterium]
MTDNSVITKDDIEVLAPAGDLEKLKTVVEYGADAVYMSGKQFGLRTFSGNFTHEEMIEGISYAHSRGVKCYVTMNIMAHEADMSFVDDEIRFVAYEAKADAVIVSDIGIFARVREVAPDLEIHVSTQASVTNSEGCKMWYKLGAKRIVLAREVSLAELSEMKAKLPSDLAIECFVHGAMCVSYSGRCLLSNYYTGRSSNKGACAQPCRWGYYVDSSDKITNENCETLDFTNKEYFITEEKRLEDKLPIEEDAHGTYIFNSKDICMVEYVPDMIKAGVNSFKIEGRIKGAYYAAAATKVYREAVDSFFDNPGEYKVNPNWLVLLDKVVHRDYATGFFFDEPGSNAQIVEDKSYNKPAFVVGVIEGYDSDTKMYKVSQRNKVFKGDTVNCLMPKGYVEPFTITELYDEDMNPIDSTPHAKMTYFMRISTEEVIPYMSFISRDGDKDQGITKQ